MRNIRSTCYIHAPDRGVFNVTHLIDFEDLVNVYSLLALINSRLLAMTASGYHVFLTECYPHNNPVHFTENFSYVTDETGHRTLADGQIYDTSTCLYGVFKTSSNIVYKRLLRGLIFIQETDGLQVNSTTLSTLQTLLENYYNSSDYQFVGPSGDGIEFLEIEPKLHFKQNWRFPRRKTYQG